MRIQRGSAGFTLIEILVALVITLVGLMGGAGLLVRTVKQEVESYQRLQALSTLQDMVDRFNANREVHSCYAAYGTLGTGFDFSTVTGAPCTSGSTAAINSRVTTDLQDWNNALLGLSVQDGSANNIGAMIGARGCIAVMDAATQTYRITVAWQGLTESATAVAANTCGKDDFGDETLRRVVSAVVRIGDLS